MRTGMMLCCAALAWALVAPDANADLTGDRFSSEKWRVSLDGPKGWQLNDKSSYPSILLWMAHRRPDARMLFAAESLTDKEVQTYANETAERLKKLGFRVRAPQFHSATGAYWMDFDDGEHYLRQAVLVPEQMGVAYSLTLSAPDLRTRGQLLRAFDYALRSIRPNRKTLKADPRDGE